MYRRQLKVLSGLFRAVPGKGILKGFIPEKLEIISEDYKYETTFFVVAVSTENLQNSEYNCILNADIFERGKRVEKIKVSR